MSLIEILVSLLILSLILLGFDAAEVYSFHKTEEAYFFNVAVNQLQEITERLTALGSYDGLDQQVALWNLHNQAVLPQGKGSITKSVQLKINWGKNSCLTEDLNIEA